MIQTEQKGATGTILFHNEYVMYENSQEFRRIIRAENKGDLYDFTLRTTLEEDTTWYTDDSVKLLKQETYTLLEAHRLNITGTQVISEDEIPGLNTRNCIDGMIAQGETSISWITSHVVACHKTENSYEFLISRYSMNNDYKGINDPM